MAARNVGINSTFEQQRQVINQIAADIYTIQNTGIFNEEDPLFASSPASGISSSEIINWNSAYSWGNHSIVGYATEGYVDNSLVGYSTSGVLYQAISDALVGYATEGYVATEISSLIDGAPGALDTLNELSAALNDDANFATTITNSLSTKISGVGIESGGVLVGSSVTTLNFIGEGNSIAVNGSTVDISISGSSGGQFSITSVGIHTFSNVGIGTTNPTSSLTVDGNAKITGIVTAERFESTSAGTPTIDSPNNLNINAVNVAISTDLTVGGTITAGNFSGDAGNLTNIKLPWIKLYLNTQANIKPPQSTIANTNYLGLNWGSWYSCTFLNSANTAGLSPSSAVYDPTLYGIGFSTDRFSGFLQGSTYEFTAEVEIFDSFGRAPEVEQYKFESSTGAFSNTSIWYPGSGVGTRSLIFQHSAIFTFEDSISSNNWIKYRLHSNISPTYYVGYAILTIKKLA